MTQLSTLLLLASLSLPLLGLSGCMPVGTLRPGTDSSGEQTAPQGLTMAYRQSPDLVFQAVLSALSHIELSVIEQDPARRYILAEHGQTLASSGENIGVYFAPHQGGTQVTVACRAKNPANPFALDYSEAVHQRLGLVLGGMAQQP